MDFKQEYIICCAVHLDDGYPHDRSPTLTGFIVTGRRYADCYDTIGKLLVCNAAMDKAVTHCRKNRRFQGFLTSANRFVSRKEAYQIAKRAGQLLTSIDDQEEPELISENLY